MKRVLFLSFLLSVVGVVCADEVKDSIVSFGDLKVKQNRLSWNQYNPERGFFQKAFTDAGDPRFMITNEDETFTLGIGGTFRMTTYYDVCGAVRGDKFSTYDIPIPTEYHGRVGLSVESSNIYFKSKAKIGKRDLIAVVRIKSNADEKISLNQAYASYGGLTVGKVYSFFMDLAAGVTTVDLQGPNTQISHTLPLIGYTFDIGKHFTVGASIEKPNYSFSNFWGDDITIEEDHQGMPDLVAKVVYRNSFGHLQASALFRQMCYKNTITKIVSHGVAETEVNHKVANAFGVALSGHINTTRNSFVSFQGFFGKGISDYINDLDQKYLSMKLVQKVELGHSPEYDLEATPVWGAYAGYQYNFSKRFNMSAVYGIVKLNHDNTDMVFFDNTQYAALSGFYHFNDYFMLGAEVLYGKHKEREHIDKETSKNIPAMSGGACRANLMFSYTF